uniref:Uncharacterized protein n=1 Tax=Arundo donax TaxID=35708 RepID=A0A0A9E7C9_ARUDO
MKKITNATPGNRNAVCRVIFFHSEPLNIL